MKRQSQAAPAFEYLTRLLPAVPARSRTAISVVEWADFAAQWLGIAFSVEEERDYVSRARGQVVRTEVWRRLRALIDQRAKAVVSPDVSAVDRNIGFLAEDIHLSRDSWALVRLMALERASSHFEMLLRNLNEQAGQSAHWTAIMLGMSVARVTRLCAPSAELCQAGILTWERSEEIHRSVRISEPVARALVSPIPDAGALRRELFGVPSRSALDWQDFDHLPDARDFCAALMRGALAKRESGINILVYGPPGTGKTEFCKMVADQIGVQLYSLAETDQFGGEPNRRERLTLSLLADQMLAKSRTLLLFDEIEDLLGRFWAPWEATSSRVFMHRLLERNAVPKFWTCNNIESIDPAVRRRMTFAVRIGQPPPRVRERIWSRVLAENRFKIPDRLTELANHFEISPATAANAARAARIARGGYSEIVSVAREVDRAVRGGNSAKPIIRSGVNFSWDLVNASIRLEKVIERLVLSEKPIGPVSMLFYGPPGTGKSLAAADACRRLGVSALHKRPSDLLSPWVGGTERAIAEAFAAAREEGAILIFDEVDSILGSRALAGASWDITQVNEMLTWLEHHPLPVIGTTNLLERLDTAALRRFALKVEFRYLAATQIGTAYQRVFGWLCPPDLLKAPNMTPADLANAAAKGKLLGLASSPTDCAELVRNEIASKPDGPRQIGFQHR